VPPPRLALCNTTSVATSFHASGRVPCCTASWRVYLPSKLRYRSSLLCLDFPNDLVSKCVVHLAPHFASICDPFPIPFCISKGRNTRCHSLMRVYALLLLYLLYLPFLFCVLVSALSLYYNIFVTSSSHRLFDYFELALLISRPGVFISVRFIPLRSRLYIMCYYLCQLGRPILLVFPRVPLRTAESSEDLHRLLPDTL
jgi:hypothetical protein